MASVQWSNLFRWALVWVEYGTPKKDIHARGDIECVNCNTDYKHGVNHSNEFSYKHMGIVISKNIKDSSVTVVPLTETKHGDEDNQSRVVLKNAKYQFINKDTTILIDNIITIEKKRRITAIKLTRVPEQVRRQIKKAMLHSFK